MCSRSWSSAFLCRLMKPISHSSLCLRHVLKMCEERFFFVWVFSVSLDSCCVTFSCACFLFLCCSICFLWEHNLSLNEKSHNSNRMKIVFFSTDQSIWRSVHVRIIKQIDLNRQLSCQKRSRYWSTTKFDDKITYLKIWTVGSVRILLGKHCLNSKYNLGHGFLMNF